METNHKWASGNVWHMEVADDSLSQFDADGFDAACDHARETAKSHGGTVHLYPGPVKSGVTSVATYGRSGRRIA